MVPIPSRAGDIVQMSREEIASRTTSIIDGGPAKCLEKTHDGGYSCSIERCATRGLERHCWESVNLVGNGMPAFADMRLEP